MVTSTINAAAKKIERCLHNIGANNMLGQVLLVDGKDSRSIDEVTKPIKEQICVQYPNSFACENVNEKLTFPRLVFQKTYQNH